MYFGTPEVAVAPLQALCRAGHDVALVVTRPARRRGRRQGPTPSPVAVAARDLSLDVTHDPQDALRVEADLGVVVAYGELISAEILQRLSCVNLHFSLLPRWRGAAPVERAILAGDAATGVCLMDVAPELDAGAVYRRATTAMDEHETAGELRDRLCGLGIGLMLDALAEGLGEPVPQHGEVTWAAKMSPSELRIDWSAPAERVLRLVRVGGSWTQFRGRRLKILQARALVGPHRSAGGSEQSPAAADHEAGDLGGTDGGGRAGTLSVGCADGPDARRDPASDLARAGAVTLSRGPDGSLRVEAVAGDAVVELVQVQSEGRAAASARDWANGARLRPGERFDE